MTFWWIIGVGAVALTIYFVFLARYMKKRTAKQLAEVASRSSSQPLTAAQQRLLVFGGILAQHRSEPILSLQPNAALDIIQYGLKNQWEITNAQEAHETLGNLVAMVRSSEYDAQLAHNIQTVQNTQRAVAKALKLSIEQVQATRSTCAWDCCRAVALGRWCFWLGYISETEFWQVATQASEQAVARCNDWSDYTVSFLIGRTLQGFDLDDIYHDARHLLNGKNKSDGDVYRYFAFK